MTKAGDRTVEALKERLTQYAENIELQALDVVSSCIIVLD